MSSVNNVTKSFWQANKNQDFPNFPAILCAASEISYHFTSTRFLIKNNVIPLLNVL